MFFKLLSKLRKTLFIAIEVVRSRRSRERAYRILFSPSDWADDLRLSFYLTKHEIEFADLRTSPLGKYDLIVPLNIEDIDFLILRRDNLLAQPISIPSAQSVKLCDDKVALNAFLIERGYGRLIPAMGPGLEPPFMLKKRIDAYARNCHRIASGAELAQFQSELASGDFFTQQFIPGNEEFATHILFEGGKILAHLCVRYVYATDAPIKGHDMARYTELTKCRFLGPWAELLALVQYEGLCCINYKVLDGRPMLLEINPRFGGSLAPYFFSFLRHLKPSDAPRGGLARIQNATAAAC